MKREHQGEDDSTGYKKSAKVLNLTVFEAERLTKTARNGRCSKRRCSYVSEKPGFLDPEGGSQKATLLVLLAVVISSLKIPKAFLIRSGEQRNFAYTFVLTFPKDIPSQIFTYFLISELLSN